MWNNLRDVLNAQAEGAIDCPGCGCLIDADSDCAECGFDPRRHDDECEILAQALNTCAYWIDAQAGGCACQCSARQEALMLDHIARYGSHPQ